MFTEQPQPGGHSDKMLVSLLNRRYSSSDIQMVKLLERKQTLNATRRAAHSCCFRVFLHVYFIWNTRRSHVYSVREGGNMDGSVKRGVSLFEEEGVCEQDC